VVGRDSVQGGNLEKGKEGGIKTDSSQYGRRVKIERKRGEQRAPRARLIYEVRRYGSLNYYGKTILTSSARPGRREPKEAEAR